MRLLLLSIFLLTITETFASDSFTISLTDDQQVITMFSEDINQKESLHIVTYKDKSNKTYGIKSVFIDENDKIHELAAITANDNLEVVGFHRRKEIITLLVTVEDKRDKKLIACDLNALTKEIETSDLGEYEKPGAVFTYPFKTVFLTVDKDVLTVKQIANSQAVKDQSFPVNESVEDLVKDISKNTIDVVDQSKFNENGPINEYRAYAEGDELIIEQLDQRSGNANFLLLNLNDESVQKKQVKSEDKKLRDADSYIFNGNHFSLQQEDKDEYEMNITNIRTGENLYKASLQDELRNHMSSSQWENFYKHAKKGRNAPTITVNEGNKNHLVTNIDYVNRNTYNYHDLFWHMDMMRWHMDMMQKTHEFNNQFGPSVLESQKHLYATRVEDHSIKIVLNSEFQPVKDASTETKLHNFNEDKYLEKYEENKTIERVSVAYTKSSKRLMTMRKKSNQIKISIRENN